ncbi:hypothetical protein TNCV_2102421 [Trichonephila clavipes]|nr:hypothetical protein TNCV_2102421 [Trichonephila clavipes]
MSFPYKADRGSRVVKVLDRGWPCHEFEPKTTKDPPCRSAMHVKSVESSNVLSLVAAICHTSHSCLDPNDFTVVNCIVKGHASHSPPSLRLRLCSRFTLLATHTYFDPKDFSPHPSTVSKVMHRRQEEEPMDWEDVPFLPEVSAPFVPSRPPRKMRSLISVQVSEPPSLSANRFPDHEDSRSEGKDTSGTQSVYDVYCF